MDFLREKEKYTWYIYPIKVGNDPLPKWFKPPEYLTVNYSYVEYMNRRSNGAMFPLCGFKKCVMHYSSVEDYVRIYESYKCYTAMYHNISERKFMYIEKLQAYDRDLEDLRENSFSWNFSFTEDKLGD